MTASAYRCYLTSLVADARRLRRIARAHWGVENRLHWVLDVVFGGDGKISPLVFGVFGVDLRH